MPLSQTIAANQASCGLVVIDTLARNFAGGVENAAEDMSAFVSNCDHIAKSLQCLVLIVHHSGKVEASGARGSTALLGAVSTEIEIKREQGQPGTLRISKQRDGVDGQEFGFNLKSVELGQDQDGDAVTSCVLVETEVVLDTKSPGGKRQRDVSQMFDSFLLEKGVPTPDELGFPKPGLFRMVDEADFLNYASERIPEVDSRKIARRALTGLIERKILVMNDQKLWRIR